MRGNCKQLPKVLKKNIICKIGLGLVFLAGFIFICIFCEHLIFALAPAAFAMFILMDGMGMLFRCLNGEYVEVEGTCIEVQKTVTKRRTKYIVIESGRGTVKLPLKIKAQSVKVQEKIIVYVPNYASVYDYNGNMVICEFYGIEISRK